MKKILLLSFALAACNVQAQFWTPKATTFTTVSRGTDDISIVDNNVVWLKAYDGSGGGNQTVKEYARSVDGGNTWISGTINLGAGIGAASLGIGGIHAISATTAWVAAYPTTATPGGIYKTENGGTTWTKQPTAVYNSADSFPNLVYFWNANDGFSQGDPESGYFELYTTTNGGTNWVRVPSANIPAPLTGEYGYVHNYDVVNNTIWFGTNKGRIYKSVDKGLNWTVSQSPVTDFAGAATAATYTFSNESKGLLNTSTGLMYSTADGGVTWNQLSTSGIYFYDIEYIPGTSKVVSTGAASMGYGSFYSFDDGMNWQLAQDGTQMTTLAFLNESMGFAGGFTTNSTTNGIFKYTGTVLNAAEFSRDKLAAYPNPTQGIFTLRGSDDVNHIAVFDLLGKQVFSANYTSNGEIAIDISHLSAGAYIVKATGSGAVETMKILKN